MGGLPQATAGSTAPYVFNVSLSDPAGLDVGSLTSSSVAVIGPDGSALPVTLLSVTSASADDAVAAFQVPSPAAAGNYDVQLVGGQVADPSGNRAAGQDLGTFTAVSTTPTPTPAGTSVSIQGGVPDTATAGNRGTLVLDLGNAPGVKLNGALTLSLFASSTPTLDANSVALDAPVREHLGSRRGRSRRCA
jgi:hypothetical protein